MGLYSINSLEIDKIKGFKHEEFVFNGLVANKLNVFVARNGFGKSTIAAALSYLNEDKLILSANDKFDNSNEERVSISYTINDENLSGVAYANSNTIKDKLRFYVINSPIQVTANDKFAPILTTRPIELCRIYDRQDFSYKLAELLAQNNLCEYRKCMSLIPYINKPKFHVRLSQKILS